jgi:hypothetical protein
MEFTRDVLEALGAPFPEDEVEFLPRGNWEGKARALPYIDARSVMRRLDAVVGPGNWSFDFDVLSPDGKMVRGKLTVLGVTKCDAGEGGSEDEVLKSAVSDALKRAAVHFGIGRYLYYLPSVWAPYDQRKRQFSETPRIAPAAVEKALSICGISTTNMVPALRTQTGRTPAAPTPAAPAAAPASGSAPKSRAASAEERRSIWTAGGSGASTVRDNAPESSGDLAASRPAATQPAAAQPAAVETGSGDTALLACSRADCGKPLTRGQHDVSVRAFGQPLCPTCQRTQARSAA